MITAVIFDDWNRMAKENRAKYPPGTRILLLGMDDPHHPVPPGTRGTVDHVDDGGNIHMKWEQKNAGVFSRIPAHGCCSVCWGLPLFS